jgi:hypothetical protein
MDRKLLISLVFVLISYNLPSLPSWAGQSLPIQAELTTSTRKIELEVARTEKQQETGLMDRKNLNPDRGMLFIFDPPGYVRFWMKNTYIPLDMIFLRNGKVRAIFANVPPCLKDSCPSYGPAYGQEDSAKIDQVIELKAGESDKLGLKVDSIVNLILINKK